MGEKFNPSDHLRTLTKRRKIRDPKGNEQWVEETHLYLDVKYRLLWFRNVYPEGFIDTVELEVTDKFARIEAVVYDQDPANGGKRLGKGRRQIWASDFKDYVEKCETQSIGRALAVAGFGTQFCDELDEGDNLADSPIENGKPFSPASEAKGINSDNNRQTTPAINKKNTRLKASQPNQAVSQVLRLIKADKLTLDDGRVIARVALQAKDNQAITAWAADNEISIAEVPSGTVLEVKLEQKEKSFIITSFKVVDEANVA